MSIDYVIEICEEPSALPALAWDNLLAEQASPTPFMRHAFLAALHASGSAKASTGWQPCYLLLRDQDALVAACVLHAKTHSWGEYVFDFSWAQAFQRHGRRYYPKLVGAIPFTPVAGTRLLARDAPARSALIEAIEGFARKAKVSSVHCLFVDEQDRRALEQAGWMMRRGVQFHWTQPAESPYSDFAHFLASLHRDKRKKIQQERRRVADAGVSFRVLEGAHITPDDWRFFYRCYEQTYREHGGPPYLTPDFFERIAKDWSEHAVLFVASRDGKDIASSFIVKDDRSRRAWGRYWGCIEHVPMLHFEACYYEPLAWCIERGMLCFEGGAQGEHKMARGLLPVETTSAHWVADPDFAQAIDHFLQQERDAVQAHMGELSERSPFRSMPATAP